MDVREITEQHLYPTWLLRYPRLIYIHYFLLRLLFLRSRVCRRALNNLLKQHHGENINILDGGCGEGQYLIPLALHYPNMTFTAIDHNHAHIQFLKKLTDSKKLSNCKIKEAEIENSFSANPTYAIIYIIGVLQYTFDPEKIIQKAYQSQVAGDRLLIYTPITSGIHFTFYRKIRKKYGHYDDAQQSYQPIDVSTLYRWISKTGYHITYEEQHYRYLGTLGHEIMQSLIILFTHWPVSLKIIPGLFFILLMPIFVSLQVLDSWVQSADRRQGNGLLLILQKL